MTATRRSRAAPGLSSVTGGSPPRQPSRHLPWSPGLLRQPGATRYASARRGQLRFGRGSWLAALRGGERRRRGDDGQLAVIQPAELRVDLDRQALGRVALKGVELLAESLQPAL